MVDLSVAQPQLRAHIDMPEGPARVSLFMDPVVEHMAIAADHGADRVEFYTGSYAEVYWQYGEADQRTQDLSTICHGRRSSTQGGPGHQCRPRSRSAKPTAVQQSAGLAEVSIGHAIICDTGRRFRQNLPPMPKFCNPLTVNFMQSTSFLTHGIGRILTLLCVPFSSTTLAEKIHELI